MLRSSYIVQYAPHTHTLACMFHSLKHIHYAEACIANHHTDTPANLSTIPIVVGRLLYYVW